MACMKDNKGGDWCKIYSTFCPMSILELFFQKGAKKDLFPILTKYKSSIIWLIAVWHPKLLLGWDHPETEPSTFLPNLIQHWNALQLQTGCRNSLWLSTSCSLNQKQKLHCIALQAVNSKLGQHWRRKWSLIQGVNYEKLTPRRIWIALWKNQHVSTGFIEPGKFGLISLMSIFWAHFPSVPHPKNII